MADQIPCSECGMMLNPGQLCPRCLMAAAAEPTHPALSLKSLTIEQVAVDFPQWEVLEMIGQGGMGSVLKVRQPKLDRFAAVKLLPQSLAIDPAFTSRFEREARLLAKLSHPNIVAVYDYGITGNFFYLLMEFVDGVNLRQAMRANRFEPQQALSIVPKICEALQYAHDEGVLHRDIKPENILLDTRGRVKLVDFGIAKLAAELESIHPGVANDPALTQAGATLGTPSYMAPEQKDHPSEVDQRADIYSLGVVFYELLTGELPTAGLARPSQKSGADPRIDGVVQQALEKERSRRQNSAGEFKTQVETIAASRAEIQPNLPPKFSRLAIAGAFWLMAPLVFLFLFFMHGQVSNGAPRFHQEQPWWEHLWKAAITFTAFAAPIGTTALGWIAVAQIRRSNGRLIGLKLAVFDGLVFPLLALDGALATLVELGARFAFTMPQSSALSMALGITASLTAIVLPLAVDELIIKAVWRAVKRSSKEAVSHHVPPEKKRSLTEIAAVFWGLSVVVAAIAWLHMPSPPQIAVWTILIAGIIGFVLAIPARTTKLGKKTLIGCGINIAVWFAMAALSPYITPSAASVPTGATFHCQVFEADAGLVDKLIPVNQRQAGQDPTLDSQFSTSEGKSREDLGTFTVRKTQPLTDSQVAQITPATLDDLKKGIDPAMGLLLERYRDVSAVWWHPGVAESWTYSKALPKLLVGGGATANLGFRVGSQSDEVYIDARVTHDLIATDKGRNGYTELASILCYKGKAASPGVLAFMVPFYREDDGSAHYLIVAYEIKR